MNRLPSAALALALLMTLPMACGDDGGANSGGIDGGIDAADNGIVDADPSAPRTAFRISKMTLRDPHVFPFNTDFTSTVNGQIEDAIEMDDDDPADQVLDLNATVVFRPLSQSGTTPMEISFADCSAPLATTSCMESATTVLVSAVATSSDSGTCLEAIAGTTSTYDPATPVVPVPAPCFSSNAVDVTVNLGSVTLPLKSARVSGTYQGDPATSLATGILMGYVTQADADTVMVPLPIGDPVILSSILKDEDKDTSPAGVADGGWWFYLDLEAEEVTYTVQ